MYSFLFIKFAAKSRFCPLKKAYGHKDLFCSISDTNYHLEKRNNSKSTHNDLMERAHNSAGFIHKVVVGCGRPRVRVWWACAILFFKDDVMACHLGNVIIY